MVNYNAAGILQIFWEQPSIVRLYGPTVEVYLQQYHTKGSVGLLVYSTSNASNPTGMVEAWSVNRWEGAQLGLLNPRIEATRVDSLGYLRDYDPRCTGMTDFRQYIRLEPLPGSIPRWHLYFFCISLQEPTDYLYGHLLYHAVNVYHQPPELQGTRRYAWYVAKDISDPATWYQARRFNVIGLREFADSTPARL